MEIKQQEVEVEKTIKVKEKQYVLTMNKDEVKLLFYFVNNVIGDGYWRILADHMYFKLNKLDLEAEDDEFCTNKISIQMTDTPLTREVL